MCRQTPAHPVRYSRLVSAAEFVPLGQAAARLSPAQKQALLAMRQEFLARLQGISSQRRKVICDLLEAVPDSQSGTLTDATTAKVTSAPVQRAHLERAQNTVHDQSIGMA